jgi:hypothetical protein
MNDGAMMTDDDVLRLAAQVLGNPLLFEDLKQDFTVHTEAGDWIKFARALLSASKPAALHQPTEAMLNAARDWSLKKYGLGIGSDAAIGCWQAMLAAAPAQSGEAVEADVVPNEIAELLTEPCWNLSRRDVSDLLKRIGSILYTAPQSSQPSAVVLDDKRAALTLDDLLLWHRSQHREFLALGDRQSKVPAAFFDERCFRDGAAFHAGAVALLEACATSQQATAIEEQLENFDVAVKELAVGYALDRTGAGGWIFENHGLFNFAHAVGKKYPQATATQPAQTERALTVTPAMVKAAMPWLTGLNHMRRADKESHVEEAIKAALVSAQQASGGNRE